MRRLLLHGPAGIHRALRSRHGTWRRMRRFSSVQALHSRPAPLIPPGRLRGPEQGRKDAEGVQKPGPGRTLPSRFRSTATSP
ncbi:hypothetical protein WQ53_12705 [Pseudoxanthomonas suwonensis]|uniref:Uncharacterized protein n=1 Tax=Pseudoxanthomonas suwonensis TaxID=314722 RepID=A0A0E3UNU9_9GAMM|nr:hypothetical protein WQ53_12705 [Pseudoxanthomonas suwonensis]